MVYERIRNTCATAVALLSLGSCGTEQMLSPVSESGVYSLVAYDGRVVPAAIGWIVDRWGHPTGCNRLVSDGTLVLDSEAHRFSYDYELRDSCTGDVIGRSEAQGTYKRNDKDITFFFGGDPNQTTVGLFQDSVILLDSPELKYRRNR